MNLPGYLRRRKPCGRFTYRLIFGLVIAGVSASQSHGQDIFTGAVDNEFNESGNWQAGLPAGFPDFGSNSVDIQVGGSASINVINLITGLSGLTNTTNFDNTFSSSAVEPGTFTFNSTAIINPGTGSFTFDIGVTGSSMTFDLENGGKITFKVSPTITGATTINNAVNSSMTADNVEVTFGGNVFSNNGGHFTASGVDGNFNFTSGLIASGNHVFELINDGTITIGSTSVIDGNVEFRNNNTPDASVFDFDSTGQFLINGDVTSSANGHFKTGGQFELQSSFIATGSQEFEFTEDGAAFEFNGTGGTTSFDGGEIRATSRASTENNKLIFEGAVSNGELSGEAAVLWSENGVQWVFKDDYTYSGKQTFNGDESENGTFTFEEFDTPLVMVFSGTPGLPIFEVEKTTVVFNRDVEVNADAELHANTEATYEFNGAVTSKNNAIYKVLGQGSAFQFNDEFNATGNQAFEGLSTQAQEGKRQFIFEEASFSGSGGVATFIDTGILIKKLTAETDYDFTIEGAEEDILLVTEIATFEGDHEIDLVNGTQFYIEGKTSFADAATIDVKGSGLFSAVGAAENNVTTGTGITTFNLEPTALDSESIEVQLGSEVSTVVLGGDLLFTSSGTSEDENAVVTLAGKFELSDDIEETTITSDLKDGGLLKITNNAFQELTAGTLDITSGEAEAIGGSSLGNGTIDVDLKSGTTLKLQPSSSSGGVIFSVKDLMGVSGSTLESMDAAGGGDLGATLRVASGTFAGTLRDGSSDSPLSLSSNTGEFTLTGTGEYTGTTDVFDSGVLVVSSAGSITDTGGITIRDTGTMEIEGGSVDVKEVTGSSNNGDVAVDSGGTLNIGASSTDPSGTLGGTLTAEGKMTIGGVVAAKGTSRTTITDDLTISSGGVLNVSDEAHFTSSKISGDSITIASNGALNIEGKGFVSATNNALVSGDLNIEGTNSAATPSFNAASVLIGSSGTATLTQGASLNITEALSLSGTLSIADQYSIVRAQSLAADSSSEITIAGNSELRIYDDVVMSENSSGTVTGPGKFRAGTLTLENSAQLSFAPSAGNEYPTVVITDGDLLVNAGTTFSGSANIDLQKTNSALKYAGDIRVGDVGASTGRMIISQGDLTALAGGKLTFGLSYDSVEAIGSQSYLEIQNSGVADFTGSDQIFIDVQKNPDHPNVNCYIPTNHEFVLIDAGGIVPAPPTTQDLSSISRVTPVAVLDSVTRTWDIQTETSGGRAKLYAQSPANYLGSDPADRSEQVLNTDEEIKVGNFLNSLIPVANEDPDGVVGDHLGALDTITSPDAYRAAVRHTQPVAVVSLINLAPQTQYFDVLRHEIHNEATNSGVGTPVPLRLFADPEMMVMQSDEQAIASTVRRTSRPKKNFAIIGRGFGRQLSTPTQGNVVGFDGNEYGGFGGIAFNLSKGMIIGVDLGYSVFSGNLKGGLGTERIGTLRAGPYFSYVDPSGWYIDLALSGGWNHYDFTRVNSGAGTSTDGKGDGFQIDAMVGTGYQFDIGESFAITPQASFLYSYVSAETISETLSTNPGLPIDVDPGDLNSFVGRLGANFAFKALPGLVFDVEAGWQGNYVISSEHSATAGGVQLPVLTVDDQTLNTAYYGAGVSWLPIPSLGLNLRYAGRSGDGLQSNMIYGGFSVKF